MSEGRGPQESVPFDPFGYWREVYEANEQAWTKAMKDVITTEGYAEVQGKMLETLLGFQKMARDAVSVQMNAFNIATRDDVTRLGELMVGLEEKEDRTEERLGGLEGKVEGFGQGIADLESRVGQSGRCLAGLEAKMDKFGERFADLEGKMGKLEKRLAGLETKMDRVAEVISRLDEHLARRVEGGETNGRAREGAEPAAPRPRRAVAGRAREATEANEAEAADKTK